MCKNDNLIQRLESCFCRHADLTLVAEHDGEKYLPTTFSEFRQEMLALAVALEKEGIKSGMCVAIYGENSKEWILTFIALLYIGAIAVPISIKLNIEEAASQIIHSRVSYVFVSPKLVSTVKTMEERHSFKGIFIMDGDEYQHDDIISIRSLIRANENALGLIEGLVERALQYPLSTRAAICYSTGTLSEPKGVVLQHSALYFAMEASDKFAYQDGYGKSGSRTLLLLPLYHVFLMTAIFMFINKAYPMYLVQKGETEMETMLNFVNNMQESKPRFIVIVPIVLDGLMRAIEKRIEALPDRKRKIVRLSQCIMLKYRGDGSGRRTWKNYIYTPIIPLLDLFVFSSIKKLFGGNFRFFISGASSLPARTWTFFESIKIQVKNGYGLSEIGGAVTKNNDYCIGSVGTTLCDLFQFKIVDSDMNELPPMQQGELLAKSEGAMECYWENPELTDETFTEDGWIRTGDQAYINEKGFIFILGRIKSMLVNRAGEKYCGEIIEDAIIENSPFISQVMLCSKRDDVVAIVVPDMEYIKIHYKKESRDGDFILNIINNELDKIRKACKFSKMWFPSKIIIAKEPFSDKNGQLANAKMIRRKIMDAYSKEIELLSCGEI